MLSLERAWFTLHWDDIIDHFPLDTNINILFTFSRQCCAKSCPGSVVLCGLYEKANMGRIKQNLKPSIKASCMLLSLFFFPCFASESLYFYTYTPQSRFHLAHKLFMPPLHPFFLSISLPADDLLCPFSEGIIVPLKAACRLQVTSGAFVCEARCYQQAFGCLLPFPLSNLIAAEKWKPYHTEPHVGCRNEYFPSFIHCLAHFPF